MKSKFKRLASIKAAEIKGDEAMSNANGNMRSSKWIAAIILLFTSIVFFGSIHAETVTYYYVDQAGTPLAQTDATGHLLTSSDYHPFGSSALAAPMSGPGFDGHYLDDEDGLLYAQARYYDPLTGRFLSRDPQPSVAGEWETFSAYSFANNNPVTFIDPDGRESACVSQANHCSTAGKGLAEAISATTEAGGNAAQYWADQQTASGNPLYAIPGAIASLWTPSTAADTAMTLVPGGEEAAGAGKAVEVAGSKVESAVEGIYQVVTKDGKTYVGQSSNIPKRLAQHEAAGKITKEAAQSANITEVLGGKTTREIAEQQRINELGGVKELANIRNPLSPTRQAKLMPKK